MLDTEYLTSYKPKNVIGDTYDISIINLVVFIKHSMSNITTSFFYFPKRRWREA